MTILEKLQKIQLDLKVPKNQFNKFGNFYFRNLEDITEAVKPLAEKYKSVLVISDEVIEVGGRFYVKATARLNDVENNESVEAYGYARETEAKKGMDESQITGSSSSYARKYACNGLFALDDNKDADSRNNLPISSVEQLASKNEQKQVKELASLVGSKLEVIEKSYGCKLDEFSSEQVNDCIKKLNAKLDKQREEELEVKVEEIAKQFEK